MIGRRPQTFLRTKCRHIGVLMATGSMALEAEDLRLGHGARRGGAFTLACDDLNLEIAEHEFVVVGTSGCGKTTFW